jgi:hypothetical protein
VLRGKTFDEITNLYPEMPAAPEEYWTYDLDPVWITFLVRLADWEEKVAQAVLAADPMEAEREEDIYREEIIPFDRYWRTLIGNAVSVGGRTMTIDWYHNVHTACQQVRSLATKHDMVRKYAVFLNTLSTKTSTNST